MMTFQTFYVHSSVLVHHQPVKRKLLEDEKNEQIMELYITDQKHVVIFENQMFVLFAYVSFHMGVVHFFILHS